MLNWSYSMDKYLLGDVRWGTIFRNMLLIQTHFPESFNSFIILLSWYWFRYLPYKKHPVAQSLKVRPSAYKDGTDWVSFSTLHRSCPHQHWSLWAPPTTGSQCELSLWRSRTNSISKVPSWKKKLKQPQLLMQKWLQLGHKAISQCCLNFPRYWSLIIWRLFSWFLINT